MCKDVERLINSTDDRLLKIILTERYVNCRKWKEIADLIGGGNSEENVKKMAYRHIEKINKRRR